MTVTCVMEWLLGQVLIECGHYFRLLLGFMSTTAFLSMWISNTATAAMMLPIAQAVLLEIKDESYLEPTASVLGTRQESADDMVTPVRYTRKYNAIGGGKGEDEQPSLEESVTIDDRANGANTIAHSTANNGSGVPGVRAPSNNGTGETSHHQSGSSSEDKKFGRLAKSLMLGVAYSANIGGTGTLTGTGPNIVLAGLAE